MARIKYAGIISEASGSVGSATFQKSLYGNTLRSKPVSHKSGTASQLYCRALMMQCQYEWRALDSATRIQWDQFIAFSGQHIKADRGVLMSGHSLFLKYNFLRLLQRLAILTTPIYLSAPAWPSLTTISYNGGASWMLFNANLDTLQVYCTLKLSYKRLPSQAYSAQGLRYIYPSSITGYYIWLNGGYSSVFGAQFAVNDILHYQIQFWSRIAPILSSIQTGIITISV